MFMKLRDWIDISKLNYKILSLNKNAIDFLLIFYKINTFLLFYTFAHLKRRFNIKIKN